MGKGNNRQLKREKERLSRYLVTASGGKEPPVIASQGDGARIRAREALKLTEQAKTRLAAQESAAIGRSNPLWEKRKHASVLPTVTADGSTKLADENDVTTRTASKRQQEQAKNLEKRLERKEKDKAQREEKQNKADEHPEQAEYNKLFDAVEDLIKERQRKRRAKNRIDDEPLGEAYQRLANRLQMTVPGYHVSEEHLKLLAAHHQGLKNASAAKKNEGSHKVALANKKGMPNWKKENKKIYVKPKELHVRLKQANVDEFANDKFALLTYRRFVDVSQRIYLIIPMDAAEGISKVLQCNATFNDSQYLVRALVHLAHGVVPPAHTGIDEGAALVALDCLLDCVKRDMSLRFTEVVASQVYTFSKKLQEKFDASPTSCFRVKKGSRLLSHRLLLLIGRLELGEKVRTAEADLANKNLLGPAVKGLNPKFLADKFAQTASGDLKSLMRRQATCLESVFMIFVRVLSEAHFYSDAQLLAAFRAVECYGDLIAHEMLNEVVTELAHVSESPFRMIDATDKKSKKISAMTDEDSSSSDDDVDILPATSSPAVAIAAIAAIIRLSRNFDARVNADAKEDDELNDNVTDRAWTADTLVHLLPQCVGECKPLKNPDVPVTSTYDTSVIPLIVKVVRDMLLDPSITIGQKVSTGSPWPRLVVALSKMASALDWSDRKLIDIVLGEILSRMPSLVDLYTPDGLQAGSSFGSEDCSSLFWSLQLVTSSKYTQPKQRGFESAVGELLMESGQM